MNRTVPLSVVLAALVALLAAPLAIAKLPPGTTFEACGQSGCNATADEESFRLQLKLIEPAMEHGTVVAPPGAEPWIRVDLKAESTRGLRPLLRDFPVVFAPDAGYIGVPSEQGTYRWVQLRAKQAEAYGQLADGVSPLPPQTLAELDPVTVARANPDAAAVSPAEGDGDETAPTPLVILLAAVGVVAGVGLAARTRHVRHRPAEGEPA
jgi:hypothetical protein